MLVNVNDPRLSPGRVDEHRLNELLALRRELTVSQIDKMLRCIAPLGRRPKEDQLYRVASSQDDRHWQWEPSPSYRMEGLEVLDVIPTLHAFENERKFTPSTLEVFSMIPEALVPRVRGFEVFGPYDTRDLNDQYLVTSRTGCHLAKTILYL